MYFTEHNFIELCLTSLLVLLNIVLIIIIKAYGKIPIENTGLELNLLTYGFLWETILDAFYGDYWPNIPDGLAKYKPIILAVLTFFNFILTIVNFKIAHNVESGLISKRKWLYKSLSYFMGIVSLTIFFVLKIFLD